MFALSQAQAGTDPMILAGEPNDQARARRANRARHESHRRRLIDPTICDRDYSQAEMEFMRAIQAYKASRGRMVPTWSEVLEVLRALGYEKPMHSELA
jgi:hypothetical protein